MFTKKSSPEISQKCAIKVTKKAAQSWLKNQMSIEMKCLPEHFGGGRGGCGGGVGEAAAVAAVAHVVPVNVLQLGDPVQGNVHAALQRADLQNEVSNSDYELLGHQSIRGQLS